MRKKPEETLAFRLEALVTERPGIFHVTKLLLQLLQSMLYLLSKEQQMNRDFAAPESVPASLNAWYKHLPFKPIPVEWREHMIHAVDHPEKAEAFLSFSDGPNIHELAHLICCEDSAIFDPFWGIPFDSRFEEPFQTQRSFDLEIEVQTVQSVLDLHYRSPEWAHREWSEYPGLFDRHVFHRTRGIMVPRQEDRREWYVPIRMWRNIRKHQAKWSLETIWLEFLRKVQLVDNAILAL